MSFFQLDDPVLSDIRERLLMVDINSLTPLEALNKLSEIQRPAEDLLSDFYSIIIRTYNRKRLVLREFTSLRQGTFFTDKGGKQ